MSKPYHFGRAEVRPDERLLLLDGRPAPIGRRAFDVLLALIERPERLVTKNELLDLAWPGLVVEENNLQVQISTLRKLLGPQAIATVPGRGYRFTAVLDGEAGGSDAETPPATVEPSVPAALTNLPGELPILYGRDEDLKELLGLIESNRLVTVVGAGGIGKSRLAQAAAHALAVRERDGAWMVELAGLSDPVLLPNAVAQVLDIRLAGQASLHEELVTGFAPRDLLLVLDNCEHLLDAVASLSQAVVRRAPNVTLLATSQEPLRLPQEQQYRLAPLAVPTEAGAGARDFGAVALFEARVRSADPRFALNDDNLALVIDICRHLDGLPLAIELAAARVATLGLRPVRDKLDARFKLLTGGPRATLRRHQTLHAALEWSHGLLNDAERAVFRRLGAFAGGFTSELAQAVAVDDRLDEWAVLDHLGALVEKSLVVADPGDTPRYRLLESARVFALEQLTADETAEMLKRRHALAMRDFIVRVDDANLDGELRSHEYAALVRPELDNLRAAHAWATGEGGDPEVAVALAAHAGSLTSTPLMASIFGYASEVGDWLLPLLPIVEGGGVGDALAARYFRALADGNMSGRLSRVRQEEAAIRAQSLYERLGQPRRVFSCLIELARHRDAQRHYPAAGQALDAVRDLIRPDWPAKLHIDLLDVSGDHMRNTGRFAEALALHRECVRVSATTGDWRLEVIARNRLADLLWQTGPIEEAAAEARYLTDAVRTRPAAYSDMDVSFANLIGILSETGRIDEACAAAREAVPIMRRTGRTFLEDWAYLFWRRGQIDTAAQLLGALEAEVARSGVPPQENEQRLITATRAGLEGVLAASTLTNLCSTSAGRDRESLFVLIEDSLAQPAEGLNP